uniref:Uncharacterized protein n=1 Tax=Anguilla anguilla TaxID=7936 RepID=A0A0E9V796_ANGAN
MLGHIKCMHLFRKSPRIIQTNYVIRTNNSQNSNIFQTKLSRRD